MACFALNYPDPQIPLALEPVDSAQAESALRGEYRRMQISRRLTFEQAMADTALAICIRNLAEATARRRRPEHPARHAGRTV
jgi:hypothetical protein